MNDEQYLLANAYLDGELTADERRIAEADPEVMTEVDQLRALQAELRDVPPPTNAAREAAIAAAMTEFAGAITDRGHEPHTPVAARSGAPVVPFRPRPAYAKVLGVAAAFVAVAGLGIILTQAGGGGDDDSSDGAAEFDEATPGARDGDVTSEAPIASDGDVMIAGDADDAEGAGDTAEETAEAALEDSAAAEPMAEDTAGEAGDPPAQATEEATAENTADEAVAETTGSVARYRDVPADFDPQAPITNEAELGVYGVHLIAERDAGSLGSTPNHPCVDAQHVLDEATLLLDDEPVTVYIDVRETVGVAAALRADTCTELMIGSLYAD